MVLLFWVHPFSSVAQSCLTLCDPKNCNTPGVPVHHQLLEFTQTHVHPVIDAISHLILCCPLLLPLIPPSIKVFSNESTLLMGWPKYWIFNFSMSPSNEHLGLILFKLPTCIISQIMSSRKMLYRDRTDIDVQILVQDY